MTDDCVVGATLHEDRPMKTRLSIQSLQWCCALGETARRPAIVCREAAGLAVPVESDCSLSAPVSSTRLVKCDATTAPDDSAGRHSSKRERRSAAAMGERMPNMTRLDQSSSAKRRFHSLVSPLPISEADELNSAGHGPRTFSAVVFSATVGGTHPQEVPVLGRRSRGVRL